MEDLRRAVRAFNRERDWDRYHSPKNLALALTVECAELLEIFQWKTEEASHSPDEAARAHLEEEIGDVMILLTNLADKLNIDPVEAARKKLIKNAEKYPAERAKGRADKYTAYLD